MNKCELILSEKILDYLLGEFVDLSFSLNGKSLIKSVNCEYLLTSVLVESIMTNWFYEEIKGVLARTQHNGIDSETVEDVLMRMQTEAEWVDIEEFLSFFT